MSHIGSATKLLWQVANDPVLMRGLDHLTDSNGRFLNSTRMAEELKLPRLENDSTAAKHVEWSIRAAEVIGIPMPSYRIVSRGLIKVSFYESEL